MEYRNDNVEWAFVFRERNVGKEEGWSGGQILRRNGRKGLTVS